MTSPVAPQLAHRRKRTKASTEKGSEAPALNPSGSQAKAPSSPTKPDDAGDMDSADESSELSESSEEPSDLSSSEDDDDDEHSKKEPETTHEPDVVNLRANRGQKPTYKLDDEDLGPDIRTFLKDFLPKLKAANEELEEERNRGTLKKREIDAVEGDEDQQYIEMNLGLGVLKMKDAGQSSDSDSDSEMSDVDGNTEKKEKDVLSKLMGQEKTKEPAGIEEVNEQTRS